MSALDPADTLMVFTARSPERIVREGGSQAWVLNAARAKQCQWVVCTQNRHHPDHLFSDASEPHSSAFLVGRIKEIRACSGHDAGRWMIAISGFARVAIPDVWQGWRNPVRYAMLSELGIDPAQLAFEPMPAVAEPPAGEGAELESVGVSPARVLADAKQAVAAAFGVRPEAVEITVRA